MGCSSDHLRGGFVRFDDGEVVRSGSVELRSADGEARYAGKISADGRFELRDTKGNLGCPPGIYDAVVVQVVLTEDLAIEQHRHGRTVPRRYADYYTSGLRVRVTAGRDDPIIIELNSSPD